VDVHPTATVGKTARLGAGAVVGPYCVVEDEVEIGAGTRLDAHVVAHRGVRLGRDCHVHAGVVLGHTAMVRGQRTAESFVEIGDGSVFFPHVTVERAHGEGAATRIGPDAFVMTEVHIGHNSVLGAQVTLASGVALGGHSVVEDHAFIGGGAVQHQHVRVGKLAMVGGNVRIIQDVPPFLLTAEFDVAAKGLNLIGLKRSGFDTEAVGVLKRAFRILFRSRLTVEQATRALEEEFGGVEKVANLIGFMRASKRGVCR